MNARPPTCDLVGRYRIDAEPADQERDHREHRELEKDGEPDGTAQLEQPPQLRRIGRGHLGEQARLADARARHHHRQHQKLDPQHHHAGPSAADAAHGRNAGAPVDEVVIEGNFQQQADERDEHRRQGPRHPLAHVAQPQVAQQRQGAPGQGAEIRSGDGHGLRIDAEPQVHELGVAVQQYQQRAAHQGDPARLAGDFAGLAAAAGAVELGNRGYQRHDHAAKQHDGRPEDIAAEGDAGKIRGAVAAGHDRVRHAHAHLRELREDDGHGKAQQVPELDADHAPPPFSRPRDRQERGLYTPDENDYHKLRFRNSALQ